MRGQTLRINKPFLKKEKLYQKKQSSVGFDQTFFKGLIYKLFEQNDRKRAIYTGNLALSIIISDL